VNSNLLEKWPQTVSGLHTKQFKNYDTGGDCFQRHKNIQQTLDNPDRCAGSSGLVKQKVALKGKKKKNWEHRGMENVMILVIMMKINNKMTLQSLYLKPIKRQFIARRLRSCTCF
jgi:hypothetical protein